MSACSSVSYSSDSDEDIDIEADSPKRTKVMTKKKMLKNSFGAHHVTLTLQWNNPNWYFILLQVLLSLWSLVDGF